MLARKRLSDVSPATTAAATLLHCSNAALLLSTDNKKMNGLNHEVTENGHELEVHEKADDEALKDGDKKTTNGTSSEKDEQEVVFIQDMGFTVKIVSPGTEAFDIQVS